METRYTLSPEQLSFYEDNGYLMIKQLVDYDVLKNCSRRFQQIDDGELQFDHAIVAVMREKNSKNKEKQQINKIQDIANDDVFFKYISHPRVVHVVTQIIGDRVNAVHSMFINKPTGTGRHPPHQDILYLPARPYKRVVGMWTAVDRVTSDNGAIFVIPGSHKPLVLYPHECKMNDSKLYHSLVDEAGLAPESKRIYLDDMSPGDTLVIHPLLIHGSKPNISKSNRKAITCHYFSDDSYYIDPKDTPHELVTKQFEKILTKKGLTNFSYMDMLRLKTVPIKALKSNL